MPLEPSTPLVLRASLPGDLVAAHLGGGDIPPDLGGRTAAVRIGFDHDHARSGLEPGLLERGAQLAGRPDIPCLSAEALGGPGQVDLDELASQPIRRLVAHTELVAEVLPRGAELEVADALESMVLGQCHGDLPALLRSGRQL